MDSDRVGKEEFPSEGTLRFVKFNLGRSDEIRFENLPPVTGSLREGRFHSGKVVPGGGGGSLTASPTESLQ